MRSLLALALLLAAASTAQAQPVAKSFAQPRFLGRTADQILDDKPDSPNPYLGFLPAGVEADYDYWDARLALEAHRRALRSDLVRPRGGVPIRYTERETANGANDGPDSAEDLPVTRGGASNYEVTGNFGASRVPAPADVTAMPEGPMGPWNPQTLTLGPGGAARLRVQGAQIGDGPYAGTTGDVDLYVLDVRQASAHLKVSVDTPQGSLDPVLALYTEQGVFVDYNDDRVPGGDTDAATVILRSAPGRYYLFVYGYTPTVQTQFGLGNPLDPSTGFGVGSTGAYVLDVALVAPDPDAYGIMLQAGDVLSLTSPSSAMYDLAVIGPDGTLRMRSRQDISAIYPEGSPFSTPADLNTTGGAIAGKTALLVVPVAGRYTILAHGEGDYRINVRTTRPRLDAPGGVQTIFVDFDGATIDANAIYGEGNPIATLSPLAAFLPRWGLSAADENAVIDGLLANLRENLLEDLRRTSNNPEADLVLLNSRDHPDPFGQPGVSRLIIGGTIDEVGIGTIGLASSIDPGNYDLEDTAFILLDLLSNPPADPNSLNQYALAPGRTKVALVAQAVGNVSAHEAGHFLGLFHTDQYNDRPSLQDAGGNMDNTSGVGPDRTFGTADDADVDFTQDEFVPDEGFQGIEDQANAIAFGIGRTGGTRGPGGLLAGTDTTTGVRVASVRGGVPEAEGYTYDFGGVRVRVTGLPGEEQLWVLRAGSEVWEEAEACEVALILLDAGIDPAVEGMDGTGGTDAQAGYDYLIRVLRSAR